MPSNSLLYFITKIIKFEGFKATNYHFITENELLIELENKATITTCSYCQKKKNIHKKIGRKSSEVSTRNRCG